MTFPCSRPTRRSRATGTTSTAPGAPAARRRSSAITTTPPDPLADLTDDEVCAIVVTWRERSRALQAQDDVAHVLIFENRGALVGTSNPHPHCQIYAGSLVYATMARECRGGLRAFPTHGARRARRRRRSGSWPAPGSSVPGSTSSPACRGSPSTPTKCTSCPASRRRPSSTSTTNTVAHSGSSCATSCGAMTPCGGSACRTCWPCTRPRWATIRTTPSTSSCTHRCGRRGCCKYLAGPEVGGGSMTNESNPDEKAAELRATLG